MITASTAEGRFAYLGFSGYRTNNEDKTYIFVTHDLGKTWKNISGGLNNPLFDLEEDPDNANVLYMSGDFGIYVSLDAGQNWTPFSTTAPTNSRWGRKRAVAPTRELVNARTSRRATFSRSVEPA